MRAFIGFTKRNLTVYFSDRQTILFSMLTPIIVLSLYLLFISGNYTSTVENSLQKMGMAVEQGTVKAFVNGILLTGILGSAVITIPFHTLMTMVQDRARKIDNDVLATPMKRGWVILGYFAAAVVATTIMGSVVMVIGIAVMVSQGMPMPEFLTIIKLFLTMILGAFSSTALFIILLLVIRTESAAGAISGIISAVSGFIIGAYMPISQFGKGIQTVCNLFPATGITVMIRDTLTTPALNRLAETLPQAPKTEFIEAMRSSFGYEVTLFGRSFGQAGIILYVAAVMLACLIVLVMVYSRTYRKK